MIVHRRREATPAWRAGDQGGYNGGMAGNTFGERFRVTTAGVSHGPGYLCIIDGCPAGLPLGVDDLLPDLRRRRPGQSKLVTNGRKKTCRKSGPASSRARRTVHRLASCSVTPTNAVPTIATLRINI